MRSSLVPIRPLRRVCDACKQQQRKHATPKCFTHPPTSVAAVVPRRHFTSRPSTSIASSAHKTQVSNSISLQTRRTASTSSAASPEAKTEEAPTEAKQEEASDQKTHYDLFPQTLPAGPPPNGPFAIDTRTLRREFLTLQAIAHPDLAPAGAEKRHAEAASARINEAYKTLSHPLLRAQYLLSLQGFDVANEETARVEDPALLMLVLETREAIEEAGAEEDLEPLREENELRIRETEGLLGAAMERGDLDEARVLVTRLRYWVNIRESIQNWERGKPIVLEH
ncbi:hypothetical protein M426DRAFT_319825 [Hypoxylon sp. CI-4A]|nr:hypothetical protein M426DRAFT_319825 [Hypoxylon sp. CI-4A]